MQKPSWLSIKYIPPAILAVSLMVIYLQTMAPGLTWSNNGEDGGDLITAAVTGGVAHPTGYPTYLLLARLFQWLPIGTLAYRTNLMSAILTAAACVGIYHLVTRSLSSTDPHRHWFAGLVSAFAFGLSPLAWSQAVITEVYALHALFVVLILYLSLDDSTLQSAQKRTGRLLGLTFGLAMGNHVTTILLIPMLLPSAFLCKPIMTTEIRRSAEERQPAIDSLLRRLTWLGIGLLVYLTLPLRALLQSPVNWGNASTLNGFGWLVSAQLYQDQILVLSLSSLWLRVQAAAALLTEQFGIPGLVIGLIGLVVFYRSSRLHENMIWIVFVSFAFAIVYATHDSFMYLIPAFLCFAIWIGVGLAGLMDILDQRFRRIGVAGGLILIVYLFVLAGNHWRQVDASRDLRAERFGGEVLAQVPRNAIVFAEGDKAIFAMWYFHYALKERSDLVVVATGLLSFDWYQESLLTAYPGLKLSVPFPFSETVAEENPGRSVCFIEYVETAKIDCLPAQDSKLP